MLAVSGCPVRSLYVHVPFCARKCAYCAFFSEAANASLIQRFVQALIRDMERVSSSLEPNTIFFGGGTPSLLSLAQWETLLETMSRLGWTQAREWTVECNPATVTLEKARLWRDAGVSRLSLGVQSLDPAVLEGLGRIHTRAGAFKSFDILRQAGFSNLNLDLMFAVPGQTMAGWKATLAEALAMQSEHLACYEVIYEEDTPLFHQLQAGAARSDEDLACAMYEELLRQTDRHGLVQYEIANFACPARLDSEHERAGGEVAEEVPGHACRHNINYWRGGPYCGLGPAAAGFVGGRRYQVIPDTARYCAQLEAGEPPETTMDDLCTLARAGEIAAFGLRMNCGWPFSVFQQATGFDLRHHWGSAMDELVARGWGIRTEERFRLSTLGLRFADAAAERFLR